MVSSLFFVTHPRKCSLASWLASPSPSLCPLNCFLVFKCISDVSPSWKEMSCKHAQNVLFLLLVPQATLVVLVLIPTLYPWQFCIRCWCLHFSLVGVHSITKPCLLAFKSPFTHLFPFCAHLHLSFSVRTGMPFTEQGSLVHWVLPMSCQALNVWADEGLCWLTELRALSPLTEPVTRVCDGSTSTAKLSLEIISWWVRSYYLRGFHNIVVRLRQVEK